MPVTSVPKVPIMDQTQQYNNKTPEKNGLTGIPQRIHCTATEDSGGSEVDELDRIDIENFLDALAQVALSVATRRAIKGQREDS